MRILILGSILEALILGNHHCLLRKRLMPPMRGASYTKPLYQLDPTPGIGFSRNLKKEQP